MTNYVKTWLDIKPNYAWDSRTQSGAWCLLDGEQGGLE